jgi:hypothetical protein
LDEANKTTNTGLIEAFPPVSKNQVTANQGSKRNPESMRNDPTGTTFHSLTYPKWMMTDSTCNFKEEYYDKMGNNRE